MRHRIIIALGLVLLVVIVYGAFSQTPQGVYQKAAGIPAELQDIRDDVEILRVALLREYYQDKQDTETTIAYYTASSVTHIQILDGTYMEKTLWLTQASAALADINAKITSLEGMAP